MRRLAHQIAGVLKHAVNSEDYWEFKPGEAVIADGYLGKVTAVQDGPYPGIESYLVELDNGAGGGEYTAAQLTRPGSATAALVSESINLNFHKLQVGDRVMADGLPGYISFVHQDDQAGAQFGTVQTYTVTLENGLGQHLFTAPQLVKSAELVEGSTALTASHWYPELGTILEERIPNEQLQVTAGLRREAASTDDDEYYGLHEAVNQVLSDKQREMNERWQQNHDDDENLRLDGHKQDLAGLVENADLNIENGVHHEHGMTKGQFLHASLDDHPYYPEVLEKLRQQRTGSRTAGHDNGGHEHMDPEQFDTNPAYRQGYQHGLQGESAEKDSAQARVDTQRHDRYDVDYLVGHDHGTEQGRTFAEQRHNVQQLWEKAPEYNSVEHQVNMLGHELRHEGASKYPYGHVNGVEITDHEYSNESGIIQCDNCGKYHSANYDHDSPSQGRIHAVVCPQDNLTDYYTDERLQQRPKYPARGSVRPSKFAAGSLPDDVSRQPEDGTERGEDLNVPDVCSFCGNPGPWTDEQDTGRGTRIRCGTCGGTMRLNSDEVAGTSGIQWQPEFPNSPQNAASGAGDPRATTNDLAAVHSALNVAATLQAGHPVFHAPELASELMTIASVQADDEFRFHFTASWFDVRKKAKRIRDEDGVRILGASSEGVIGEVRGDTATYESAINYVPGTHKVAVWACGCKWGAYAWGRSPGYKRFEGRQCSHVLALQFEAQARGMFGREVTVDPDRMDGQYQRSPVTVQYQRPTERDEGGNINRRTVPPGNMRSEWHERSRTRRTSALTPAHTWARLAAAVGIRPAQILDTLRQLGLNHGWARQAVRYATSSPDSTLIEVEGSLHHAVEIEGDSVLLEDGRMVATASVRLAKPAQEATAYPGGGQANPGTDIPGIDDRDQSERKKKHLLHHTNDAREHAHNFGYGLPWGGTYGWCDQCQGSGCGHCGGTGQVAVGTGLPQDPSDLSSTETPMPDQSVDSGDMIGDSGSGMNATGAMHDHQADAFDWGHSQGYAHAANGLHPEPGSVVDAWYNPYYAQDVEDGYSHGYSTWHNEEETGLPHRGGSLHTAGGRHLVHIQVPGGGISDVLCGATPTADRDDFGFPPPSSGCPECHRLAAQLPDGTPLVGRGMYHDSMLHTADYSSGDLGPTYPAETNDQKTPTSNSPNPGSTGFATSADPGAWVNPVLNQGFDSRWEASARDASGASSSVVSPTTGEALPGPVNLDLGVLGGVGVPGGAGGLGHVQRAQAAPGQHVAAARARDEVVEAHAQAVRAGLPTWTVDRSVMALVVDDVARRYLAAQQYENQTVQLPNLPVMAHMPVAAAASAAGPEIARIALAKSNAAGDAKWNPPTVSGVAVKAHDTGRVLMIQRSMKDDKDPAKGTWEMPGGHHEDGDLTSLHAGIREWQEEVGQPFPMGGHVSHTWRSGPYQGHVVVIPTESMVDFSKGRSEANPDDPDGDDHEQAAWWDPEHARKNPALRTELKVANPFESISKAASGNGPYEPCAAPECRGFPEGPHSNLEHITDEYGHVRGPEGDARRMVNDVFGGHENSPGWLLDHQHQGPTKFSRYFTLDEARAIGRAEEQRTGKSAEQLLREGPSLQHDLDLLFHGTLHDEPEPALPSTDGASEGGPDLEVGDDAASGVGTTPWPEVAPGVGMERGTPWGYPEQTAPQPQTPDPGSADVSSQPSAGPSGLFQNESSLTPEMQLAAQANPIIAAFQQTAAFRQMAQDAGAAPDQDAQDVAAAARAHLAKVAAKNFSFAEQQELISEGGGKVRARNFHDLRVEGTHYERIGDDDEAAIDPFLFL